VSVPEVAPGDHRRPGDQVPALFLPASRQSAHELSVQRHDSAVTRKRLFARVVRPAFDFEQLQQRGRPENLFHPRRIVHAGHLDQQLRVLFRVPALLNGRLREPQTVNLLLDRIAALNDSVRRSFKASVGFMVMR